MPTTRDLLKARFAIVRGDLDQAISRLSDDLLDWAPRDGMRTVRGQLLEIAATEMQNLAWLKDRKHLEWKAIDFRGLDKNLDGLKALLSETREQTLAFLDSFDEAGLEADVAFPGPWWEALGLPSVPLHEALRSLAAHEWYHTGQLVSYLWSRGDDPEKWAQEVNL